jgi:CubicO group peptidase (beta-lactamase class C family)
MFKAFLGTCALVFIASAAAAQDAAQLDEVVQTYVQNKTFMGSVLVARDAKVILNRGYGSANLEWNVPNTPTTKFRLGSITKQFTAASILLLEERGKLKLEDPIKMYLPDAPSAWDRITIFNLLTHTSGIPNFTSLAEYKTLQLSDTPPAKTIATVRDRPLDFFPGEKMSYSNSGYILLGYVIEKITGASYEQFVRDNIFTPLAMKDSGYDSNSAIIERRAAGYSPSPSGPINAGYVHMSIPHAAGALYSTTEDLLRWEQGLFGGKVVSAASLKKMTTPFKNNYALGVVVQTADGRTVISHGGGIEGFNTFLAYYPDDKLTVVVLSNINGPTPNAIATKLATVAHGGTVQASSERKEITLPVATLEKFVGTDELAPGMSMWIRRQGDHLTTQLSGQGQLPMFAESATKFFLKAVDAQIEFVNDAAGAVTAAVLHQNERDLNATRKSATVVEPPEHKEIAVPVETLSKYTGTYQMRPNVELSITLDGQQLMAQLTGQQKFPIFAESATLFFFRIVDATLEFQTDASGMVTSVRLRQGPVNELGLRK